MKSKCQFFATEATGHTTVAFATAMTVRLAIRGTDRILAIAQMVGLNTKKLFLLIFLITSAGPTYAYEIDARKDSTPELNATEFSFSRLDIDDGLPDNKVWSIAQDRLGFMWFGTRDGGLSRFDGYEFKVFQHDPDDPTSLAHNYVWTLLIDKTGILWVGTNGGGLDRYDERSETFLHYGYDDEDPSRLPHSNIKVLFQDSQGQIWVGSNGGLSLYDRRSNSFTTLKHEPGNSNSLAGNSVRAIMEERDSGIFWIGTRRNGVSIYDRADGSFVHLRHDPADPASLSNDEVEDIYQDRAGRIWIATRDGLNRFDPAKQKFVRYKHLPEDSGSTAGNWVSNIFEDKAGRFWVTSLSGMDLYNSRSNSFVHVTSAKGDAAEPIDRSVNTLFEDSAGAIWFGTVNGGVSRLDALPPRFRLARPGGTPALNDRLPLSRTITALEVMNNGELWLGYQKSGLDGLNGNFRKHFESVFGEADSLIDDHVTALAQDNSQRLWIGTREGLSLFDGKHFTRYVHGSGDVNSISGNDISVISPDGDGGLWVGLNGEGVDHFDGQTFTRFPHRENDLASFPTRYPKSIMPDERGRSAWIGTNSAGLVHIDRVSGDIVTYPLRADRLGSPLHNFVRSITRDHDGAFWLASNSGVIEFDPRGKTYKRRLTMADGLPSNTIMSVETDDQGMIWIASIGGLSRFNPVDDSIQNFDPKGDLFGTGFLPRLVSKDQSGRLYWGTGKGVLSLLPSSIVINHRPPPVVLTGLKLLDRESTIGREGSPLEAAITVADRVKVSPGQNTFSITFSALDFSSPSGNRYAYKLEGYDSDWRDAASDRREARYTNVAPGKYIFRVKGSNADGVWNEQGPAVSVVVLPLWWQTIWFKGGVIFAVFGLIAFAFVTQRRLTSRFEELAKFSDQSPHAVMRLDSDDRLIYSNNASGSLLNCMALKPGDRAPREWETIVAEAREQRDKRETLFHCDSCDMYMNLTFNPLLSSESVNIYGHDVTDRMETEDKLRHAQKMETVGQLAGGIAHDFNNLLAAVILNMELLYESLRDDETRGPLAKSAIASADKGARLTQRLLAFSRKQALDPKAVQAGDLVRDMDDMLRRTLGEHIDIEVVMGVRLWLCEVDAPQLENALLNLAINARDAMPDGGKLTIETRNVRIDESYAEQTVDLLQPGQYVLIAVTDTGTGISKDTLDHIFEPFFTTKEVGEGSGLGLSMVYGFTKQSGGHLTVYSEVGKGTTFKLYLPRSMDAVATGRQAEHVTVDPPRGHERVLIIEDEPEVRLLVETILTDSGYRVVSAGSGPEALVLLTSEAEPDLLLTDAVLPGGMSGVEVAAELKERLPSLKVLFMSGYTDNATIHGSRLDPGVLLLQKPFRKIDLLRKVHQALKRSSDNVK